MSQTQNYATIFFACLAMFLISTVVLALLSKRAFDQGVKYGRTHGQISMTTHFMQVYDFHKSDEDRRRKLLESAHDVIHGNPISVRFHDDCDSGNAR